MWASILNDTIPYEDDWLMESIGPINLETDSYKLVIAADRMKALLWLKQAAGLNPEGQQPGFKDILRILNSNGVVIGIKQKDLTEAVVQLNVYQKPSGMITAAEGEPVVDGTPFEYKFAVQMARPQIDNWIESGSPDLIIRSETPVTKGTIILDISSGLRGRDGRTVLGEKIPYRSYPIIKVQPGLHVHTHDNKRFTSEKDGFVQLEKNFLSIIPFENMFTHVELSKDEMEAWVRMESDGLHTLIPSREQFVEELKYAGVVTGINLKEVEQLLKDLKTKTYDGSKKLIAKGQSPTDGQDAHIRFMFKITCDKCALMPGSFDCDESHDSLFHKDSVVAEKMKIVPAVDGFTITGRRIPARQASDVDILTENFYLTREDRKNNKLLYVNSVGGNASFRGKTLFLKPYQDASVEFKPDETFMELRCDFHPALGGGKTLNFEEAMDKFKAAGYVYGLNQDLIRSTVVRCQTEETPILNLLCGQATAAVHGEDSKLKIFFRTSSELVVDDEIAIDFKNRETVPHIKPDVLAAEIIQPTLGKPGTDLRGKTIPAKDGKLLPPIIGKNMRQTGDRIFSSIEGWPIYRKNTLSVLPYFETEGNVDYSTGNIYFPGTVMVKGDVLPGFSVFALKGELIIKGNATNAILKSSSNILISGGAKSCDITCEGDITLKFVEYSKIRAQGNVTVLGSSLNNYIVSGHDISLIKGKGYIVGGKTLAANRLELITAGNDVATETILMAGEDFISRNKVTKITKMTTTLQNEKNDLHIALQKVEASPLKEDEPKRRNLQKKIHIMQHQLERLERVKSHFQSLSEKAHAAETGQIIIRNAAYPGSIISVKNAVQKPAVTVKAQVFGYDWGTQKMRADKYTPQKK